MFTQCPNCKTTFQVTATQLKAANGDVRCGQCLTVFNALDNLSEIEPLSDKYVAVTDKPSEELTSDTQNTGDASTSIDKNLEEFFGDLFEDSPDESFDQPIALANPEPSTEDSPRLNDGFFYGANEATIEKILEAEETNQHETTGKVESEIETEVESEIITENETEVESEIIIENDSASEPAGLTPEKNPEVGTVEFQKELETISDQTIEDVTSQYSYPEKQAEISEIANVPHVILDELEAAKAQHLKPPSTPWVVGSMILMLVLVLQAIYFSRDSLATNPSFRPLLTSACNILGCEINIKYDTRLIEIIGRDVRSHPTSKKALIAGTTLINNASYAQPYPLLTLTFSDITGTKLAQRRFTPREYLRSGTDVAAGMPSEVPVQVELHLVDPGKAAVNFEFRAEVDPRS